MALAFVLMVVFSLAWAEKVFHLAPFEMPDYMVGLLVFSFFWALVYDLRSK